MGHHIVTRQENGIPLDTAAIVSTVIEGILYGISIMMFIWTIWTLTYRRTPSHVNRAMIIVSCLMLLFSTTHMIIDIIRTYEGLVEYRNTFQPDGPIGFFSDVSQWSFVYKNLVYTLQTLVGDGVVIYRCYVLWQSRLIIVIPIILWASLGVTGFGCVYFETQATVSKENVFAPTTGKWITAFISDALFTNILVTSLLAYRIWKLGKRVRGASRAATLWPILRIILDAGVLYSVSLLALLMCFLAKNRGHFVMLDLLVPIVSITFYMVIIRTTRSVSKDVAQPSSSGYGRPALPPMSRHNWEHEYQMKRMEVHITQLTETNERDEYVSGDRGREKDREAEGEVGASPPTLKVLDSFSSIG